MIKNNNFDPERYDYPSVVPLTNYLFFEYIFIPLSWAFYYLRNLGEIIDGFVKIPLQEIDMQRIFQLEILGERELFALWWGRLTTATFGVGVVVLTFILSKKLWSTNIALIASSLVAVNYRHVLNSHIGLPDIYNSYFLLLSCLVTFYVYKKPTLINYSVAAVFAGISMATKYQFFAFIPLLAVHFYYVFKGKNLAQKVKYLFAPKALLVPVIGLFIFVILNPYMFIHIEETHMWLSSVSGKYRTGRNMLDIYPLSYLYHVGLGQITSILVILGVLLALFSRHKTTLFLVITLLFPFFYITIFATGGGFYTRNFVTIIPFLCMVASFGVVSLGSLIPKKSISRFIITVFAFFALTENFSNSIVVANEYQKRWNFETLSLWLGKNIEENAKISAHSSVPLPIKGVVRLPFEFPLAFSIEEFREQGANYAIANMDWQTNDFYWWMTQDTKNGLEYWSKPIKLLEESYPARALAELQQFAIHSVVKPWQAPDSHFVVAEIPEFEITNKGQEMNVQLSETIDLTNWPGYVLTFDAKTESQEVRDGYVYMYFYENRIDADKNNNRKAVRLSKRNVVAASHQNLQIVGKIDNKFPFARIESGVYNPNGTKFDVKNIKIQKSTVIMKTKKPLQPIKLDSNILYPWSHGYL